MARSDHNPYEDNRKARKEAEMERPAWMDELDADEMEAWYDEKEALAADQEAADEARIERGEWGLAW